MRVLVVGTPFDSENMYMAEICKELSQRNHKICIWLASSDKGSNRSFEALKTVVKPWNALSKSVISSFDLILCGRTHPPEINYIDKYIFSYDFTIDDFMPGSCDFLFTTIDLDRYFLRLSPGCPVMPIGNVMNRKYIQDKNKEQKTILYIDSGHTPYGTTGKAQIADMLLRIAEENPENRIVIKPRWLRDDTNFTHRNLEHLYDVIEDRCESQVPDNLVMLNRHFDIDDLLQESCSVIAIRGSTVFNAANADKSFCILRGYDSLERFDQPTKALSRWDAFFSNFNCDVNINDIYDHMPFGIKHNANFMNELYPESRFEASKRVVDTMEYVYFNFISKGFMPMVGKYSHSTYLQSNEIESLDWDKLKRNRFRQNAIKEIGTIFSLHLSTILDADSVMSFADEEAEKIDDFSPEMYKTFAHSCRTYFNSFIRENHEKLMHDEFKQAQLIRSLFENGYDDEILEMSPVLCPAVYNYYAGRIWWDRKQPEKSIPFLLDFIKETQARLYDRYFCEVPVQAVVVYNMICDVYNGENIPLDDVCDFYVGMFEKQMDRAVHYTRRKKLYDILTKKLISEKPISESMAKCSAMLLRKRWYHIDREYNERIKKMQNSFATERKKMRFWGMPYRLSRGVQCVRDHGFWYTVKLGIKKPFEQLKKKTADIRKIGWCFRKNVMAGFGEYARIVKKRGVNAPVYISAGGTGDVYIICKFLDYYLTNQGSRQSAVIWTNHESRKKLYERFGFHRIDVSSGDQIWRDGYALRDFLGQKYGDIIQPLEYLRGYCGIFVHLEGFKGLNIFDIKQLAVLQIKNKSQQKKLKFNDDKDYFEKMFFENNLQPGNTVLLAPYAKWSRPIPFSFWISLAKRLIDEGFSVCTNLAGGEECIPETVPIYLDYYDIVPFLDMAGYKVSLRSGFDDITESSSCKTVVLYSHNSAKRGLASSSAIDSFSLVKMFDVSNCMEIIASPRRYEAIPNDIISYFQIKEQKNENHRSNAAKTQQ